MIRDGDMFGHNITILEESSRIGAASMALGPREKATCCAGPDD